MVSPPILKREREEEQGVSPLCVTGELGSPTVKPPPDTRSPEEGGGEMDLVGGNKPVEVPDPEDSSTMEESVVTFSGQRRKEPLVGDLVSSPESVGSNMEKRENAVLGMDILVYRLERNGARENAGSNPEDVSTGEGMAATLSGTGNTKPLVGYWTQSPESVRSSVGEIEDTVPCRDTYPFEGNWVRENTGSGVEGTLIWTENQTPFMVDRTPALENEKVYDRDAGDTIPLSDLHQLGKALGSRVADVGNGAHHESAAEGCDTLVDTDPLDLSRDQVHMEGEIVVVTRRVDIERGKSTVNGENRMLMEVVDPEPLTGDHVPFRKETGKSEFMEGEKGVVVEKGRQCQ